LLVFRDNRPVESYTRVGEVEYLKHFLAVARSAALSRLRQRMVVIANSYLTFSYYIKWLYNLQRKKNSLRQSPTDSGGLCSFIFSYCGTIKYRDIWVIIINSFRRTAQHYTVLFFILCPLSRYVFTCLRRSNGPSPMQSAVYLYISNLSSKKPCKTDI